jgi:hypothetical protein
MQGYQPAEVISTDRNSRFLELAEVGQTAAILVRRQLAEVKVTSAAV